MQKIFQLPNREPHKRLDRVTQVLLAKGTITPADIGLMIQHSESGKPSWRSLVELDLVNRDKVYRTAANSYGFEIRKPSPERVGVTVDRLRKSLPVEKWETLFDQMLVPIDSNDSDDHSSRVIFASHDPSRHNIESVIRGLECGRFSLVYTDQLAVESLISVIRNRIAPSEGASAARAA